MVSLTFYVGVNEIGGNNILLEDSDRRLFLDFGFPYKRYKQFYEEYLKPRRLNQIDGVLLSHAHLDHLGHISFLRDDFPVYTTAVTACVIGESSLSSEALASLLRVPESGKCLMARRRFMPRAIPPGRTCQRSPTR